MGTPFKGCALGKEEVQWTALGDHGEVKGKGPPAISRAVGTGKEIKPIAEVTAERYRKLG